MEQTLKSLYDLKNNLQDYLNLNNLLYEKKRQIAHERYYAENEGVVEGPTETDKKQLGKGRYRSIDRVNFYIGTVLFAIYIMLLFYVSRIPANDLLLVLVMPILNVPFFLSFGIICWSPLHGNITAKLLMIFLGFFGSVVCGLFISKGFMIVLFLLYSLLVMILRFILLGVFSGKVWEIERSIDEDFNAMLGQHNESMRRLRESNKERYAKYFEMKEKEIEDIEARRDVMMYRVNVCDILGERDKNLKTVNFIIAAIEGKRAETIKEALILYDNSERYAREQKIRQSHYAAMEEAAERQVREAERAADEAQRMRIAQERMAISAEQARRAQQRGADELKRIRRNIEEQ